MVTGVLIVNLLSHPDIRNAMSSGVFIRNSEVFRIKSSIIAGCNRTAFDVLWGERLVTLYDVAGAAEKFWVGRYTVLNFLGFMPPSPPYSRGTAPKSCMFHRKYVRAANLACGTYRIPISSTAYLCNTTGTTSANQHAYCLSQLGDRKELCVEALSPGVEKSVL